VSFKSTNAISVHKFAAGHRYLSYRWPSAQEQEETLGILRLPAGDARILSRLIHDVLAGATITRIPHIDFDLFPPGDLFRRNLWAKGLTQAAIETLVGLRVFPMDDSPAGLDWFPLETNSPHGPFRWSGPNPNPRYFLPIASSSAVRVRLCILNFADESLAGRLTVELNDNCTTREMKRGPGGTFEFSAISSGPVRNGLKLQFHLPHNAWRREFSPARYAGFALSRIEVEPVM
jgi:hypothetical protein